MKLKNITLLTLSITILFLAISNIGAQELKNVEIQTIPLQDVRLSSYGIVVHYTTSNLYRGTFYFPVSWFQATYQKSGEETTKKVVGNLQFLQANANKTPLLKIKYADGKLSEVTLILPNSYENTGIPQYRGTQEDIEKLKEKFDRQESLDYLPFKEFQ